MRVYEVKYLRTAITHQRIRPDPSKVQAIPYGSQRRPVYG